MRLSTLLAPFLLSACAIAPAAAPPDEPAPAAVAGPSELARPAYEPPPSPAPTFDRTAHSITEPASIWVIVNKRHPIRPLDHRPETPLVRGYRVAKPVVRPLTAMLAAADRAGLSLKIASAFRSYDLQAQVYAATVASRGQAEADRVSARPGHSEHQTGLAVDFADLTREGCAFEQCFATTPGGRWLARHSWRFGFVQRYTRAHSRVTGYTPEPWHFRYVGRPLAAELHRSGESMEEFFGVAGGGYRGGIPSHRGTVAR